MIEYPTKCKIVDVNDKEVFSSMKGNTPEISKPHIGKKGVASKDEHGRVIIQLDDGNIIYGYECWWKPIDDQNPIPG